MGRRSQKEGKGEGGGRIQSRQNIEAAHDDKIVFEVGLAAPVPAASCTAMLGCWAGLAVYTPV